MITGKWYGQGLNDRGSLLQEVQYLYYKLSEWSFDKNRMVLAIAQPASSFGGRGLEPIAFFPMGNDFVITSSSGTDFVEEVDLIEGDWVDYDADNDLPVSMSEIQFKWDSI